MTNRLAPLPPGAQQPNTVTHRKGEHLMLSSGSYSDYRVHSILRVEKDCDLTWLAVLYTFQAPMLDKPWAAPGQRELDVSGFAAWLLANGWATEIETDEISIDDYHPNSESFGQEVNDQVKNRRATKL